MNNAGARLRKMLDDQEVVIAPGIYDHMSLLLAQKAGHTALYASGYWGMASALGEPDVGIAGMTDFLTVFGRFARQSDLPIIADADTGFGSLTNLARTVEGYCGANIAAMQIEDQPFPKVCGHVGRAASVPVEEMVKRIDVAREARGDCDMMIIARTDARRSEGVDAVIARLQAYEEVGADIVFFEAPETADEIAMVAEAVSRPLMINAAHGGHTPILDPAGYAALGARLVIYPAGAPLSALQAVARFYDGLAAGNANSDADEMYSFKEISRLLGMDDVIAFQDRHGAA